MLMHHTLKRADVIMVLGSGDTRVAEYAAQLYLDGLAPVILFTGSGSINNSVKGREKFIGTTEADVFATTAISKGVPETSIIIENKSQSTGENFNFGLKKLEERGIKLKTIIIAQKPYVERRAYAAAKIWLPKVDIMMTSPKIPFDKYPNEFMSKDRVINSLVGDLQRIREYPNQGFQIPQEIPVDVWKAYEYLVGQGYTEKMIK